MMLYLDGGYTLMDSCIQVRDDCILEPWWMWAPCHAITLSTVDILASEWCDGRLMAV